MNIDKHFLDEKRREGDEEADRLVVSLCEKGLEKQLYSSLQATKEDVIHFNPELQKFYSSIHCSTTKFDPEKVKAGQLFYRKYAMEIMMLLGAMSLPYCYAATPGNKALYLTEKIRYKTGKRLFETAEYVISIMEPGCLDVGGSGHHLVNKTRLIHSMVRYRLLNNKAWKMEWDVPINQEDMAGTNLAFSYIIVKGLKNQGFQIRDEEIEHFLYTWRYIGFLLHIDEALLPETTIEAEQLEETIKYRNFSSSAEGKLLMKDLLSHYRQSFPHVASWLVDSQIRYFLGGKISRLLGMKFHLLKDPITYSINKMAWFYNKYRSHNSTYDTMMRDHEKSRMNYGLSS